MLVELLGQQLVHRQSRSHHLRLLELFVLQYNTCQRHLYEKLEGTCECTYAVVAVEMSSRLCIVALSCYGSYEIQQSHSRGCPSHAAGCWLCHLKPP